MKKILVMLCLMFAVTACATAPQLTTDQKFEAYRNQLRGERTAGKITPVEEQEKLRDYFWNEYGKDAENSGHFAFSISLMRSVQAGRFPLDDADALIAAKQDGILAEREISRRHREFCTYDCLFN